MRHQLVKGPNSALFGAKCGLCTHPVRSGESVLFHHMPNDSYDEDRLVFHRDCMAALVNRAPAGVPSGDHRARAARIRSTVEKTGSPFAEVA